MTFVPRPGGRISPVPPRRHLLGIHAILSGTVFDKAAFLARAFFADVDPDRIEVDLYLVGGGGAGGYDLGNSATTRASGGAPGGVRIVQGLLLDDLIDGTAIRIGAGAAGRGVPGAAVASTIVGGSTAFGPHVAYGGASGGRIGAGAEAFRQISDVALAAPTVQAAATDFIAPPSSGPGVGASWTHTPNTQGGEANAGTPLSRRGGFSVGSGAPRNGLDAPDESLGYGSGGASFVLNTTAGGSGGELLRGGRPGGGGGARVNASGQVDGQASGRGGDGIIRLAVYEWSLA